MKEQPKTYRPRGVRWTIEEVPVLWTRPKAYIYDCQQCGKEFRMDSEIHIPHCPDCRLANLMNLVKNDDRA